VKPSPFTYHRPATLDEALAVLAEVGDDGKVLAGGQSLLPILSMRLAAPGHLVDINRLSELDYLRSAPDGVRVGAVVRHAGLERDARARRAQPLLGQAVHADPSGELTAVLALTGGSVEVASASGRRTVPAGEFFLGPLESAVQPGELAIEAFFPALPPGTGTAFVEVARRHGDYAVCGVAAAVTLDADGEVSAARAAYISMAPVPAVLDLPQPDGDPAEAASWQAAGEHAASRLDPEADIHASAEYRSQLAGVLTTRALAEAAADARSAMARSTGIGGSR